MEAFDEFSHYCNDQTNKCFVLYNLKDKSIRRCEIPYETVYLLDSAQIKRHIYFTGGGLPPTEKKGEQFFQYTYRVTILPDLDTKAEKLQNMKVSRASHTCVALTQNLIYVVGGCNSKAEIPSCEEYNIESKTWREIAFLNEKKMWVSVCPVDSRYLYAFGGSSNLKPKESELIEFLDTQDPSKKLWTKVVLTSGKENWKRCFFAGCIQISSEDILLFGGLVDKKEVPEAMKFNYKKCTMAKGQNLAKADAFYRMKPGKTAGEVLCVGSCEEDMHIYNIGAQSWKLIKKDVWNPETGFDIKADTC